MFRLNFMISIHWVVIFSFYSRVCLKYFRTITLKPCLSKSEFSFSEQPAVFYKRGVLKNFAIFTGKHLCRSFFFINLKTFRPSDQQLYQKGPPNRFFPVNITNFSRTSYLQNICERLLLVFYQLYALVVLQTAFHTSIYVMFMITNFFEPRMRKLILHHLVGSNCLEFRNGLLDSCIFKLNLGSDCQKLCFWQSLSKPS